MARRSSAIASASVSADRLPDARDDLLTGGAMAPLATDQRWGSTARFHAVHPPVAPQSCAPLGPGLRAREPTRGMVAVVSAGWWRGSARRRVVLEVCPRISWRKSAILFGVFADADTMSNTPMTTSHTPVVIARTTIESNGHANTTTTAMTLSAPKKSASRALPAGRDH